ncbi:putative glycosyltransferase spore coat polysaccharide biosynthesis protein [Rhizobium leguminosarum bv. trifolii WSM2304]|uniref:Glycosyltransferase spore coat polysaccharide biosynthesis protein n=1 Tax=Rhizobium leguminosarum bv. trifolii (strain WSM2304) TaxID=395492 RepID=A0ABF7QIB8_RHILW|nr:glycosyl transferase [Rhizobium leguminosarum]ACI53713.1 putative glycosyltransferase spore coat polysaccharide biosynthesis protein [Rhizobium leguminosarum bv. trifolii WSM2304]
MFVFCIESSHARGMGHLFRSLTLATELRSRGHSVRFAANDHPNSLRIIRERGFDVALYDLAAVTGWEEGLVDPTTVPSPIWINDRLDTRRPHSETIKRLGAKLVTFDDRGDGAELADMNICALLFEKTEDLKGEDIRLGVEYMILNPEIERYRRVRQSLASILVTLGGADTYGVTVRVAKWLSSKPFPVTIVTGPSFQHMAELEEVVSTAEPDRFKLLNQVPSLAAEMYGHDLAITGGGVTPFEACAAGLPCVVIANEPFEIPVGRALEGLGAAFFAGHHSEFDLGILEKAIPIRSMSETAMTKVDLGGVGRIAALLERLAA